MTQVEFFIMVMIRRGHRTGREISFKARDSGHNKNMHTSEWAGSRLRKLRQKGYVMRTGLKDSLGSHYHAITQEGEKAMREYSQ